MTRLQEGPDMENIEIRLYDSSREAEVLSDIAAFWKTHYADLTPEEAVGDLQAWTAEGHELYVILRDGIQAGFLHMGSRGGACDWLEDVFVREELRGRGRLSCWRASTAAAASRKVKPRYNPRKRTRILLPIMS